MMMMSGKFCDLDHKALITGKRLIYFRSTSGPVVNDDSSVLQLNATIKALTLYRYQDGRNLDSGIAP